MLTKRTAAIPELFPMRRFGEVSGSAQIAQREDVSSGPWKERGSVMDRFLTLLRNPNQPDRGSDCYPRVRREHHQAVT